MKNEPKAKKDRHAPVLYVKWAGQDEGRYLEATADPRAIPDTNNETIVAAKYELVGYVRVVNKTTVEE